ncbi:MAG: lysophospholipid acyltransferase family protein [Desulfobacter postgatei]|uniref:lysophospholipid acyltransferase family protein n=1 Tax=Desulfobacter postgatei TaxID=2293 RepID=UPI0023F012EE|nr:lysophospholipid acyltransferase family protein [Desulfobacter postgatei]MDD4272637.1 lysophospholipid acyltransferase family protein [Desulfobacter postgatei]
MSYSKTQLNKVFSAVFIVFIGISSAFFFCVACVLRICTAPFDPRRIVSNVFSAFWASVYTWAMPYWFVKIVGREKLDIRKNYVFVSNHQSQLDILVLYRLLFPYRWVSKSSVFRLPFIGWNMAFNNGDIKLKRGDKESIKAMMAECEDLLRRNISIFFFPEGTRSKDGHIGRFKPGAFILAKNTGVDIQPIAISNTNKALPKHSLTFQGHTEMTVKVLDTIPFSQFSDMAPDNIAAMVRSLISEYVC